MNLAGGGKGNEQTDHFASAPPTFLVPPPPWHLTGAAILFPHGWRSALALVHYDSSPVGSYDELAVSLLTKYGPSVVEMVVNSQASMIGGREGWGFPKQLGELQWERRGRHAVFCAGNRQWRVRSWGPVFPIRARLWSVQVLDGEKVKVPLHAAGRIGIAFQGRRLVFLIESFAMTVLPPLSIE